THAPGPPDPRVEIPEEDRLPIRPPDPPSQVHHRHPSEVKADAPFARASMRDLTLPSPMSWLTSRARFLPACVALLGASCIRRGPGAPGAAAAAAAPAAAATVTLAPAERHQRLEGFGASLAWHLDRVAGNPAPGLYETLFPELGLDILRLRNRYQR